MYMNTWIAKLNGFLTLNDREILNNAGSISHEIGKENAEQEYLKFKENKQKIISEGDFEKAIKKIRNGNNANAKSHAHLQFAPSNPASKIAKESLSMC